MNTATGACRRLAGRIRLDRRASTTFRCAWVFAALLVTAACSDEPRSGDPATGPENQAERYACDNPNRDPGGKTLHRLNRVEYDNTVRDLLGDTSRPAQAFPADEHGDGFDNNSDVLSVGPLLMEKYEAAAEYLADMAWGRDFAVEQHERFEAEVLAALDGSTAWTSNEGGEVSTLIEFRSGGLFTLSAAASGRSAAGVPPLMRFKIDGRTVAEFEVTGGMKTYSVEAPVQSGPHLFAVEFANAEGAATTGGSGSRSLTVDWIEVERPGNVVPFDQARLRICDPAEGEVCVRSILERFLPRAWRRPVTAAEVENLVALAGTAIADGGTWESGAKLAIKAALLSPYFLFRVEEGLDPADPGPQPLTGYEVANRLSYFLWSSMPDDALFEAAANGTLSTPEGIASEVRRMLADPKSHALISNFVGQWLHTRAVDSIAPSTEDFPEFDDSLRAAMRAETEAFVGTFFFEDRNALDMLDADFVFLNDRLAEHYGLPPPGSEEMVLSPVPTGTRLGLLTHASILAATSHPDRTSPVLRGNFVLSQLMCRQPPPPPDNVPDLEVPEVPDAPLRVQIERHRADPTCASCHATMDPIGFAFENYDAVGAWREEDRGGFPIDASGSLPNGATFSDARELAGILKQDPAIPQCITQKLMTYAMGRGLTRYDRCELDRLTGIFAEKQYRLSELIVAIATSRTFTTRGGLTEE